MATDTTTPLEGLTRYKDATAVRVEVRDKLSVYALSGGKTAMDQIARAQCEDFLTEMYCDLMARDQAREAEIREKVDWLRVRADHNLKESLKLRGQQAYESAAHVRGMSEAYGIAATFIESLLTPSQEGQTR